MLCSQRGSVVRTKCSQSPPSRRIGPLHHVDGGRHGVFEGRGCVGDGQKGAGAAPGSRGTRLVFGAHRLVNATRWRMCRVRDVANRGWMDRSSFLIQKRKSTRSSIAGARSQSSARERWWGKPRKKKGRLGSRDETQKITNVTARRRPSKSE